MSEKKIFLRRTHLGSQILFIFNLFHHFFSSKSLFISFFYLFSVISTKLTHLYYFIAFLSFMFGSPNCCQQYGDTNVACFSVFVQVYMILHKSYDNIPEKYNRDSNQRIDSHRLWLYIWRNFHNSALYYDNVKIIKRKEKK